MSSHHITDITTTHTHTQEWLAQTGKAPSLLDLIRLDAEDKTTHGEHSEDASLPRDFGSTTLSNNSW